MPRIRRENFVKLLDSLKLLDFRKEFILYLLGDPDGKWNIRQIFLTATICLCYCLKHIYLVSNESELSIEWQIVLFDISRWMFGSKLFDLVLIATLGMGLLMIYYMSINRRRRHTHHIVLELISERHLFDKLFDYQSQLSQLWRMFQLGVNTITIYYILSAILITLQTVYITGVVYNSLGSAQSYWLFSTVHILHIILMYKLIFFLMDMMLYGTALYVFILLIFLVLFRQLTSLFRSPMRVRFEVVWFAYSQVLSRFFIANRYLGRWFLSALLGFISNHAYLSMMFIFQPKQDPLQSTVLTVWLTSEALIMFALHIFLAQVPITIHRPRARFLKMAAEQESPVRISLKIGNAVQCLSPQSGRYGISYGTIGLITTASFLKFSFIYLKLMLKCANLHRNSS